MAIKFVDLKYKDIFENINLELKNNQIVSIVGQNGSGKTSFLKLIYGLDLNFEGKITIDRKNIHNKIKSKDLSVIRNKMYYLKQDYQDQLFNITILDDIKYIKNNLSSKRLDELLKMFYLNKEILNKSYFELSDGELKKILLISMLVKDSKIILLDDPTSGLDQKSISSLIKILKKEKREGKIIIITSQDTEFLLSVSDKILFLNNKRIFILEDKYMFFDNQELLNICGLNKPNVLLFREKVLKNKKVKLVYRDNINDLIKDIYRSAK